MTDMEGVCGVIDRENWVLKASKYYEDGKKLLTLEVNAAVEGLFEAGATEVYVIDGHGHGGLIHTLLDRRTFFVRGFPGPWPFTLDSSFDAIIWIGQHAKAGTEYAHIAHTGSHHVLNCSINDISVGEFGQLAMCGAFLGVKSIFLSGDEAATKEAKAFVKGIETVSVKRGLMPGTGNDCSFEYHTNRNIAAVHMHPEVARELIKEGARKALERFVKDPESFQLLELNPPFKMVTEYRPSADSPKRTTIKEHATDLIKMLNS